MMTPRHKEKPYKTRLLYDVKLILYLQNYSYYVGWYIGWLPYTTLYLQQIKNFLYHPNYWFLMIFIGFLLFKSPPLLQQKRER